MPRINGLFRALLWLGAAVVVLGLLNLSTRARISGRMVASWDGSDVSVLDLATGREKKLIRLYEARGYGGLTEVLGKEVFLSGQLEYVRGEKESSIFAVDTSDGRIRRLCRGVGPAVVRDQNCIVFYADQHNGDTLIALLRRAPADSALVDTLGFARTPKLTMQPWMAGRSPAWWSTMNAPVEIDSGCVATLGPDGAVWKVSLRSGRWTRLGHLGLIPYFWQPDRRVLVCKEWEPRKRFVYAFAVGLSDDGRVAKRLPALDEMSAYAPSPTGDQTLIVTPGWPLWGIESYDLKVYDWSERSSRAVRNGCRRSGRMVWTE